MKLKDVGVGILSVLAIASMVLIFVVIPNMTRSSRPSRPDPEPVAWSFRGDNNNFSVAIADLEDETLGAKVREICQDPNHSRPGCTIHFLLDTAPTTSAEVERMWDQRVAVYQNGVTTLLVDE